MSATPTDEFRCLWADDCTWLDTIMSPFFNLIGEPIVGILVAGLFVMAFYIYNDDLAMPATISLLFGGMLISLVPGDIQQTAVGFLVVGGVAAVMVVFNKYVL